MRLKWSIRHHKYEKVYNVKVCKNNNNKIFKKIIIIIIIIVIENDINLVLNQIAYE